MSSIGLLPMLWIGKVAITVQDLDRVAEFYREVVGLRILDQDGDIARLGTRSMVLLELRRDAAAQPPAPHEAGLFHVAFLLPTRADLARWAVHAARLRAPIEGASDHLISEAFYLSDPEGNGVEITCDRPRDAWTWDGGLVTMTTNRLNLDDLFEEAGSTAWDGIPDGATVGHVHLKVGAIVPAEAFYAGVLGVPLTARYPGGSFFGTGGYHHHLAANIWNSRGAGQREAGVTGLASVEIRVAEPAVMGATERRAAAAGLAAARLGSILSLRDPWGTVLDLSVG